MTPLTAIPRSIRTAAAVLQSNQQQHAGALNTCREPALWYHRTQASTPIKRWTSRAQWSKTLHRRVATPTCNPNRLHYLYRTKHQRTDTHLCVTTGCMDCLLQQLPQEKNAPPTIGKCARRVCSACLQTFKPAPLRVQPRRGR